MPLAAMLVAVAAGYLLGTVPSADIATRRATGGAVDLRSAGTGNPGAANAIALIGARWGYAVMAADIAKGALAALVGWALAGPNGAHAGACASVVGHCFPVWNRFRGGKGVAASVGQCLVTFPAYVPIDLALAALTASRRFKRRAYAATVIASAAWVGGGLLWWWRDWPNLWGPSPTRSLPIAAAVSSAVILQRFHAASRKVGTP